VYLVTFTCTKTKYNTFTYVSFSQLKRLCTFFPLPLGGGYAPPGHPLATSMTNFIIFLCITFKLFSLSFVPHLTPNPATPLQGGAGQVQQLPDDLMGFFASHTLWEAVDRSGATLRSWISMCDIFTTERMAAVCLLRPLTEWPACSVLWYASFFLKSFLNQRRLMRSLLRQSD